MRHRRIPLPESLCEYLRFFARGKEPGTYVVTGSSVFIHRPKSFRDSLKVIAKNLEIPAVSPPGSPPHLRLPLHPVRLRHGHPHVPPGHHRSQDRQRTLRPLLQHLPPGRHESPYGQVEVAQVAKISYLMSPASIRGWLFFLVRVHVCVNSFHKKSYVPLFSL